MQCAREADSWLPQGPYLQEGQAVPDEDGRLFCQLYAAARMVIQLHAGVPVEALLMQHPLLLNLILVMLVLLMGLFRRHTIVTSV